MPTSVVPAVIEQDPVEHENLHVHAVYDQIASHFSSTRYKPWPIIAQFLDSLPPGSIGLDSGTGNGKYLPLPLPVHGEPSGRIWTIGLDRSLKLLEIAQNAGGIRREVVWGDALGCGWRIGAFDYAISIATIHHLATQARRQQAIETLLQCISPSHGRALVYVWAIEQDQYSKRILPSNDRHRDHHDVAAIPEGRGQDVFVPWILSKSSTTPINKSTTSASPATARDDSEDNSEPQIFNRYYHMFAQGELEELARRAAVTLGLEVDSPPSTSDHTTGRSRAARKGVEIIRCGWERSNWYIELKRWEV